MTSKVSRSLVVGACLIALVAVPAVAVAAKGATEIKNTRLDNVRNGQGDYSGKLTSNKNRCKRGRTVTVVHLSDPEFVIGTTTTDRNGKWSLRGNVPPSTSPQNIEVRVEGTSRCKEANRTYDVGDISG